MMTPDRTLPIIALAVGLTVACDRKPPQTPPSDEATLTETEERAPEGFAIPFPTNRSTCTPEATKGVDRWIAAWRAWRGYGPTVDPTEYVELDAPRVEDTPYANIHVGPDSLEVNDDPVTLATLHEAVVERDRRRLREQELLGNDPPAPMSFGIGVAPDVPFARVVEVMRRLPVEEGDQFAFYFAAPPLPDAVEPPPEDVRARLRRLVPAAGDAGQRLDYSKLREAWQEGTKDCPPLRRLGDDLERAYPDERRRILAEELGDRWAQCDCDADIELVVGYQHFERTGRPATSITVVPDPNGTVLARVPEMKWSEIAPRLLELRGKPICIESEMDSPENPLSCASGAE